ncbi:hypothetical protein [Komagataeibacter rhaeticus]|uniref:hypothetical protein n=1 Tax=Komagataeibacter rhaeticus TaxID=215221 RepID=UPI001A3C2C56|nr:hypothetical protein [Komagataeibacter rhaeticus]MBL7238864.1 hypothetical protein [Komagataeibacter rhaeticus]
MPDKKIPNRRDGLPMSGKTASATGPTRRRRAAVGMTKKQIIDLIAQKALPRIVTEARVLGGKYRRKNTAVWRKLGFDAAMQKAAEEKFFSPDLAAEYTMTLEQLARRSMEKDAAETAKINKKIEAKRLKILERK